MVIEAGGSYETAAATFSSNSLTGGGVFLTMLNYYVF